jgi:hypothetical protein
MPIPWTLLACAPPHSSLWHPVSLRVREGTFEGRKLAFDLTDGEVIASNSGRHPFAFTRSPGHPTLYFFDFTMA